MFGGYHNPVDVDMFAENSDPSKWRCVDIVSSQKTLVKVFTQPEFREVWSEVIIKTGIHLSLVDDPLFRKVFRYCDCGMIFHHENFILPFTRLSLQWTDSFRHNEWRTWVWGGSWCEYYSVWMWEWGTWGWGGSWCESYYNVRCTILNRSCRIFLLFIVLP